MYDTMKLQNKKTLPIFLSGYGPYGPRS